MSHRLDDLPRGGLPWPMRSIQALLHADQVSLRLFFDKASEPCVSTIGEVYALDTVFLQDSRPPYEFCQQQLAKKIEFITGEMATLFEATSQPENCC